jgi:hypothetical protein
MTYGVAQLAPLTGLSLLSDLTLYPTRELAEGLEVVGQLTGLRRLYLSDWITDGRLLLQLAQLKQLTWCTGLHADEGGDARR